MKKLLTILLIACLCFAYAACGTTANNAADDTKEMVDDATDAGKDAVDDATDAGEDAIDDATDAGKDAVEDGKDVVDDATDNADNATKGTAAPVSDDETATRFNELNTAIEDLAVRIDKAEVPADESAAQNAYKDFASEIEALSATLDQLRDSAVNNEENGALSKEESASLLNALDGTRSDLDKTEQLLKEKFNQD